MADVGVVVLDGVVEAHEGIEPAVGGRVAPVAEAQVPLARHVGAVAQLLQVLRQSGQVVGQVCLLGGPQTLQTKKLQMYVCMWVGGLVGR